MPSSSFAPPDVVRRAVVRIVLVVALLLLAGCRVDVSVGVDAQPNGRGRVEVAATLDEEAVKAIGDLKTRLRTDDLVKAGWTVQVAPPKTDGSVKVTATHPFQDPSDVHALLGDVSGADGPLRDVRLVQRRSFFKTDTRFDGTVDLARGIEAFGDPKLTEALGGQPLGLSAEELQKQLGASVDRVFGLQVAARLPGSVDSNAPTQAGNGAVWAPKLGDKAVLQASATRWNRGNIALVVITVLATLALVFVLARRSVRRRGGRLVSVG